MLFKHACCKLWSTLVDKTPLGMLLLLLLQVLGRKLEGVVHSATGISPRIPMQVQTRHMQALAAAAAAAAGAGPPSEGRGEQRHAVMHA
jgi:hypothetical protein